jgi:hypothetical protein
MKWVVVKKVIVYASTSKKECKRYISEHKGEFELVSNGL